MQENFGLIFRTLVNEKEISEALASERRKVSMATKYQTASQELPEIPHLRWPIRNQIHAQYDWTTGVLDNGNERL